MPNEKECCRHNVPFSKPCRDCLDELVIVSKPEADVQSDLICLLYSMARHLLNPDDMPLSKWALKGAYLLGKLEKHDPERYAKETKPSDKAV